MKRFRLASSALALLLLTLLGCDQPPVNEQHQRASGPMHQSSKTLNPEQSLKRKQQVAQYWKAVRQSAAKNRANLAVLNELLAQFLADPNAENLAAAKQQWLTSYTDFQALAVVAKFHHAMPNAYAAQANIWLALDPYPIAVGYIDDFGPYHGVGIVNDHLVELTEASIRAQHAITDSSEAILGFRPLAFLLWGDNKNNSARAADFHINDLAQTQRRRQLLALVGQALANDAAVLAQWLADTGQIDVLFYRLPVLAQIELIKQASAHFLERDLLPQLAMLGQDEWQLAELEQQLIAEKIEILQQHLALLQANYSLPPALISLPPIELDVLRAAPLSAADQAALTEQLVRYSKALMGNSAQ